MNEVENTWWKIEGGSSDSLLSAGVFSFGMHERQKVAEAFKKYPFLIAEKITDGRTYGTSGTAYKISTDSEKQKSFKTALGEDSEVLDVFEDLGIFSDNTEVYETNPKESKTELVITINKPFLGKATLTGFYIEDEYDGDKTKSTIDFEHAIKSAPADSKDASEFEKVIESLLASSDTAASQRDMQRRDDYSTLATNIVNYMVNNNGALPAVGKLDATKYINEAGKDPDDNTYELELVDYTENYSIMSYVGFGTTSVYVVWHASCEDDSLTSVESDRAFAIYGALENDPYAYCLSSQ